MALLGATLVAKTPSRNIHRRVVDVTGPSSYTTNGEAITAAVTAVLVGNGKALTDILGVTVLDGSGYAVKVNKSGALFLFYVSGGTQVTSTTDLSAITFRIAVELVPANKGF